MSKHNKKARRSGRQRPKRNRNWLYFILAIVVTVAIGLGAVLVGSGGGSSPSGSTPDNESGQPQWLATAPRVVREAYAYAVADPGNLSYIPCYCGCGMHSGHKSAYNCFVVGVTSTGSVAYDQHGAGCDMCVDIALMTRDMLARDKSLKEARQAVVEKYSSLGPATDTPPIP